MSVRLTEPAIAKDVREVAANARRRDLADAGCLGLRLRLTPKGSRSWVLACRDRAGRMRRFALGDHPHVGIAEARDAARSLHGKVKHDGADPIAEARKEQAHAVDAKAGIGTLSAVLAIYGERRGTQLKSWAHSRLAIDRVFQALLHRPVATMTCGNLQLAADCYPAPKAASYAIRALRPALKWAAQAGRAYVDRGLCDLREPTTPTRRQRVLTTAELARILPVLRQSERVHATAMRFMLLTLARLEEVCGATWQEIDLSAATWTLPPDRTKNAHPHVVPLSRQAIALLQQIGAGAGDALIFATGKQTALGNWDRVQKEIHAQSGTTGWHRHDLRRTGATMLGEAGIMPALIEVALNHANIGSALAAAYNRSRYRPEVAEALQRLADMLDAIAPAAGCADTSSTIAPAA